jgi:hypothetical protein
MNRVFSIVLVAGSLCLASVAAEDRPLTPTEARKMVGKKVTVEMTVQAAKDRLEKRGEIYLDSETDFKDEKNFAVIITKVGAASLGKAGIADPAEHFRGKKIRATGTVKEVDRIPRIEIDDASQIRISEPKKSSDGKKFKGHKHTITSLVFAPDGRVLLSGAKDRSPEWASTR